MNTKVMTGIAIMAETRKNSPVHDVIRTAEWLVDALDILSAEGKPMRVMEICERMSGPYKPSVQKITAILDDLMAVNRVIRIVDPDEKEFIPLDEDFGRMVPIARFMLK